jgi:hypothetical protein
MLWWHNFGVWYAYCKVFNFVGKGASSEAVVHLMCMYTVLCTADILSLILMFSFISGNETVMKWPGAIDIKFQGDMFNYPGASNWYLIKAIVTLVGYVVPNNNHA